MNAENKSQEPVEGRLPMDLIVNPAAIGAIYKRFESHVRATARALAAANTEPGYDRYDVTGEPRPNAKGGRGGIPAYQRDTFYEISAHEFRLAIEEFNTDLAFMKARRKLTQGISPGKVMGTLIFRLCRHRLVHLTREVTNFAGLHNLQEIAVVKMAFEILEIDLENPWLLEKMNQGASTKHPPLNNVLQAQKAGIERERYIENIESEIIYLIKRRHLNQEALAILIDTIIILDEAMKEATSRRSDGAA